MQFVAKILRRIRLLSELFYNMNYTVKGSSMKVLAVSKLYYFVLILVATLLQPGDQMVL